MVKGWRKTIPWVENGAFIPLADQEMPQVRISESSNYLRGSSNVPYTKKMTWEIPGLFQVR